MQTSVYIIVAKGVRAVTPWLAMFYAVTGVAAPCTAMEPAEGRTISTSTADHGAFKELQQSFASGPEVTKACLGCHTEAAKQVQHSIHWTWRHAAAGRPDFGKRFAVNNY